MCRPRARPAPATPWSSPPLLRFRSRPSICAPIKYVVGVSLTLVLAVLLLLCLPLVLLIRFISFVVRGCKRSPPCPIHHCDLHWPCVGSVPARAVIALHSDADPNVVAHQLNRVLSGRATRCCMHAGEYPSLGAHESVVLWDQTRTRVQYVDELRAVLNEPHALPQAPCSCVVVPAFANTPDSGQSCSLLLFSLHPRVLPFCLPRLLALYSDAQLVFEVEPRLSRPFVTTSHPRLNFPFYLCHGLYQAVQFIYCGPMSVIAHSLRRVNPMWKALGAEQTNHANNRKPVQTTSTEDSTLMAEEGLSAAVENHQKISCMSVAPYSRSVAWIRVGHADCLSRAERLLRAAPVELLTALVSGTLRQHFREQGVRHPPDVGASVCVSCRDFVPVEAHRSCEAVLLPIRLPTSVEGAIPRAWAVQRRMAKALDGVLPNALKISQFIGCLFLPSSLSEKFSNALYGDNTVQISFLRAGGDLSLDGVRIQSMLMFPAVHESVLAAFCFVQCGSEMMLSVSLDKNVFPKPSTLLANFKCEVNHLVTQLSMRLLTLSQATFLPERVQFRSDPDAEEYCQDSEYFARTHPRTDSRVTNRMQVAVEKNESEHSLEELQQLLLTVQEELDGMKANPQGDRMEYIRKLTELEDRMQCFHECITQKLGTGITQMVREDSVVATNAVAELLAPYRQESGMTGRRFSREYIKVDSSASSSGSRKSSRSSF